MITALGDSAISDCKFDFGNALNDVPTMAATARVVENLGVGAYLGAAHLIDDPTLLTAAGSILTTEARHQTILNVLNNGASIPQAFDIALNPNEVLAIAGSFITGCVGELNLTANQPLTITNTGSVGPGTSLTFSSPAINGSTDVRVWTYSSADWCIDKEYVGSSLPDARWGHAHDHLAAHRPVRRSRRHRGPGRPLYHG